MDGQPQARPAVAPEGGLLQLVEAERRLTQTLTTVEQEAAAIVGAAREEAAGEAARLDQRIAAEVAALTIRIAAERDTEIARLTADADRYCRAVGTLSDEAVDAFAAEVEAQLLTLNAPEPGR